MSQQSTALANTGQKDVHVGQYALSTIVEQQLWKSDELAKVANIVFPVTALDQLPPMHKPSITVIKVNTDMKAKEVYPIGGGQFGLSKAIIRKMLNAYGGNVVTKKLTPDSDLDFIRYTALVWGKLPDGTPFQCQESKAWSWAKCQEQMSDAQARQYRQFADEQTEAKAILRAARGFLGIKTSYSQDELQKPFLIARSVFSPDLSDPDIKRMYIEQQMSAQQSIYTGPALPSMPMMALPSTPDPSEFDEDRVEAEADSGTFFGNRQPATSAEPAAEDANYDPFHEPTAEELQEAKKREVQDWLRQRCTDLQISNKALAALVRDALSIPQDQPVPSILNLDLEQLGMLAKRLEDGQ
jgi:hypothetical protein